MFTGALALTGAERAAYLEKACAGDAALAERIDALLRAHDLAQSFLTSPPTQQMAASPEEKPSDKIGRYKLLEKIGEGGCGVVWMAEQEVPVRRRVALKVIKLGMDTKSVVARFEAERQALALMDHPNIAKVFDAGTTDLGRPFFVMELVRGIPITRYCDDNNLSTEQRLQLFISVCQAIQHAHQKGIIHRDIKPSNILVAQHDDIAVAKVIDFGIAKATQGRLTDATVFTAFEQFIGTPAYMSPEQAEFSGLDVDTRSDVYSLGVLLYELITGKPPFDPKSMQQAGLDEIRRIIREVEPPRPSARLSTLALSDRTVLAKLRGTLPNQLSTELSGDLDWIVMKSLEKNRTRRYESASAFALDVSRHLSNEAVVARPPSQAYLLQKLIRRHRIAFATAAAIGVVLVLGAAVSTWQAIRATRAEREAMQAQQLATASEKTARRGEQEQARLRGVESDLRGRAEAQALTMRRQSYASDMNLVQQALAIDNLGRAQVLLNRQRPKPGETDLRGWEWRYLWQFCRSEAAWSLSDKPIRGQLSVSADGNWLAISGPDAGLWNLRTHQPSPLPVPVGEQIENAVFSPAGTWLLIRSSKPKNSESARVIVWNVTTQQVVPLPAPAGTAVVRAAFSPVEPWLLFQTRSPNDPASAHMTLWNFTTRQVVRDWPIAQGISGPNVISSDGTIFFTTQVREVAFWHVATGEVLQKFSHLGGAAIRFTPDCRLVAIEGWEGSVRVAEVASGRELWTAKVAAEHIPAMRFSPDGTILATATSGAETAIHLWDAATGRMLGSLNGHRSTVSRLVFWPDGKTLASAGQDQTIRIWDVDTRQLKRTLRGHQSPVTSLELLPDKTTLVSSAGDDAVLFWDTTIPRAPGAYSRLDSQTMDWAFAPDSQSVITVDLEGRKVQRWRGRDFADQESVFTAPSLTPKSGSFRLASDPPFLAFAQPDGHIEVWNWQRGARERVLATPAARVLPIAFRDGGKKILLSYEDQKNAAVRGLYEWDLTTGQQTRAWPRAALRGEYVVSPDGRFCLVRPNEKPTSFPMEPPGVPLDRGARSLIDLVSGLERPLEGVAAGEDSARFSPDGRLFAAPMISSTSVYSVPGFKPATTLTGTISGMHGSAFSPDSRRLAITSGGLEAVRLWDTESWEQVLTLEAQGSAFRQSAFSPDGNILGAKTYWNFRGNLHLWRAPSWAEIAAAEVAAPPKP